VKFLTTEAAVGLMILLIHLKIIFDIVPECSFRKPIGNYITSFSFLQMTVFCNISLLFCRINSTKKRIRWKIEIQVLKLVVAVLLAQLPVGF